MKPSNTFKKSFLKLMIKGLKLNSAHTKPMTIQERKRAIKNSADAAMALARGQSTRWSAALITTLSKKEKKTNNNNAIDVDIQCKWKIPTSKKILRRSLRSRRPGSMKKKNVEATVVARRMVKKRTQLLKRIIPGGESLDSLSLLGETLDYVIHLRAQVNLMQCLAKALGASNFKSHKSTTMHCKKEKDQELACDDCGEMGAYGILQPREEMMNSNNFGLKKV